MPSPIFLAEIPADTTKPSIITTVSFTEMNEQRLSFKLTSIDGYATKLVNYLLDKNQIILAQDHNSIEIKLTKARTIPLLFQLHSSELLCLPLKDIARSK